jgi:N-acetylmuramoyl-L-alanine amidase
MMDSFSSFNDTDVPWVLLEVDLMSNNDDAKQQGSSKHQQLLSAVIFQSWSTFVG